MTHSDPPADPPASPTAPVAGNAPAGEPVAAPPAAEPATEASATPDPTPVENIGPASVAAPRADEPAIPAATPYVPPPRVRRCENCGTPLLGEHCYACGQPTKGLIRQFTTILGDFVDTVFQVDSRVFRTLGPLLLRPGRLTLEYFEGHRIRYVSPVRLFVFLSILAFVAAQWSLNINGDGNGTPGITINGGDVSGSIDDAKTPEQVIAMRDRAIAEFERAKREGKDVPGLAIGMDAAAREMRAEAAARLKELEAEAAGKAAQAPTRPTLAARPAPPGAPALPAPGEGPPPGTGGLVVDDEDGTFRFNGKPWDAKTNPLIVGWLPTAANTRLNIWIGRAKGNIERLKKDEDKNWIKDSFLGVIPTMLILLLPLFALLLKVMYLFKRRLYMEHLVVALHSHAFICLVLLLQSLLALLEGAVAAPGGFVAGVFAWVEGGLWAWIPLNLLLMQKRVYGQGWVMTVLKFGVVGMAYFFLLLFGGLAAIFVTLVRA
jgi:hypothetical protein